MLKRHRLSAALGLLLLVTGATVWPTRFALGRAAPAVDQQPAARPALVASARTTASGVVFELRGRVPAGATEAILWYDSEAGHRVRRFPVRAGAILRLAATADLRSEGLVVALPFAGRLDYYWALRGPGGIVARRSGAVMLTPALRALAQAPQLPLPERWAESATEHFRIRYFPGTEAERDIGEIRREAEHALVRASAVLTSTRPVSVTVYLVPRLFWQGGVAYGPGTLLISYADRNYAGVEIEDYLTHEVTHALGAGMVAAGSDVGNLIGEGVAVYATGGHYGPEPIDDWAAVLARSDRYVPLCRLRATWQTQQHEIAYLEGASFVGYLIRTYGLDTFRAFYAHDPGVPDGAIKNVDQFCATEATRPVAAIGKSYGEIEAAWREQLTRRTPTAEQEAGLWGQIRFFDLVRTYEERRDPPARILPPPPDRWRDDLRRAFTSPATMETNALAESLFVAADRALDAGRAQQARGLMDEVQIATATGVFTGTTGRAYTTIAASLDRYARAVRLGNPVAAAAATAPGGPAFEGRLWADFRWEIDGIDVAGDRATVRVDQRAQPVDGAAARTALVITLIRRPVGWRIERIAPDPDRQPAPVPKAVPRLDVASTGTPGGAASRRAQGGL